MALELALAADIRIATADCVLGLPEIAFGLVPDVGGTTRLVRAVGGPRARELVLTGRLVPAERYGLVHHADAAAAALDHLVDARATQLVTHSGPTFSVAPRRSARWGDADTATSYRLEGIGVALAAASNRETIR
jgi:enoyl-CoA hydratase/carnithine racemase